MSKPVPLFLAVSAADPRSIARQITDGSYVRAAFGFTSRKLDEFRRASRPDAAQGDQSGHRAAEARCANPRTALLPSCVAPSTRSERERSWFPSSRESAQFAAQGHQPFSIRAYLGAKLAELGAKLAELGAKLAE